MEKVIIRVKRTNCNEGPWDYVDETGTQRTGSMVDAINSHTRRAAGLTIDSPQVEGFSAEFSYPRWRRKDKRQRKHHVRGKLTITLNVQKG